MNKIDRTSTSKQEKLETAYLLAFEYEQKYGCCPQCVLASIQDVIGIVEDATFKAAHSLAAGGAMMTVGTCGALLGGMLALSSKYGRERENFGNGPYMQSYKLAKQLYEHFVAEFGSPICANVQARLMGRSFNMWDKHDYAAFEEAGGHRDKCPSVTGRVAMWTVEMFLELEDENKPF
ncbi:MAG: C_GCAxxG_C_C family protein [uncultured bacterium]|nr:MAG: C_GCAxxG_C_C family protein [uncultured bacterium]HCS40132.1 hypothetical protein [Anaerolineaceae bacterium]